MLRAVAALAATLAVCGTLAARAPDRTPVERTLDSLFFAGRYDTLRIILPPLIHAAEARGDSAALGRLAFQKGRVEITLGHQSIASNDLDRAVRLTDASRDSLWLCAALHFKAFILRDSGNPDAAMALFERELEIGRLARLPGAEGAAVSNLAYKELRRGNLDAARRGYARMQALYRQSGNTYQIAGAGLSMGLLYRALGDIDSCRWSYHETLRLARQYRYPMHELWALNNIGLMDMDTGNWESAASCFEGALAIGRRIGFDRGQALPLMNLSLAWSYLGEGERSQRAIDEAVEVCRRAGFKDLEVGNTNVLAKLNLDAGRNRQAAALYRTIVRQDVFNRLQRSEAAYGLALALAGMDSVGAGLEVLEPFVSPRVETPDFTVQAFFEMAFAELLYRDGQYQEALDRAIRLRDEMDRSGRTDLGVAARLLESSCRRSLGDGERAAGALSLALDSLEVARTDIGNAEWREAYGQHVMGDVIEGCRVMLVHPSDAPREERVRRFYDT
ncbi:MAG TPA: tetratricopeptide repeat protein, partial [Candidatus Krumholzibacteria bacterium]